MLTSKFFLTSCALAFSLVWNPDPIRPQEAAIDAGGDVIAYWIVYDEYEKPVAVPSDYAVLMNTLCGDEPQYFIYDNRRDKVYKTGDFNLFLLQLQHLPRGVEIARLEKCCAFFSYGMEEGDRTRLGKVMEERRMTWKENPFNGEPYFMECTCEARSLRFP